MTIPSILAFVLASGVLGTLITLGTRAAVAAEGKLTRQHALAGHALQLATVEASGIARAVVSARPTSLPDALSAVRAKLVEELRTVAPLASSAALAVHGGSWYAQLDSIALAALQRAAADNGVTLADVVAGRPTQARAAPVSTGVKAGRYLPLAGGLLVLALVLTGCPATPVPVDGGPAVTPASWVSTAQTVVTVLDWTLPAADGLVGGLVSPAAAPTVHTAFRVAEGSTAALSSALATYQTTASLGSQCAARAAIDATTVALVGVASALSATGFGLAPEITSALQALAAVGDELAPACVTDAGLPPPSRADAVHAALTPAGALRPFPTLVHP